MRAVCIRIVWIMCDMWTQLIIGMEIMVFFLGVGS